MVDEVGRKYTRRLRVPHGVAQKLGLNERGIDASIKRAMAWSEIVLKDAGMPLNPVADVYLDPEWQRANARTSLEWYAREILLQSQALLSVKGALVSTLMVMTWELATLVAESRFVEYNSGNASSGAEGAKLSDKRCEIAEQHDAWREEARRLWSGPKRKWSASAIARTIDPKRHGTIRKIISDLNPNHR